MLTRTPALVFATVVVAALFAGCASELSKMRARAAKGDPQAQLQLGRLYESGQDVPRDLTEAALWYDKAARRGDSEAATQLGLLYLKGNGVPQNFHEAARLFQQAAERGQPKAQLLLGRMYNEGRGVPQDLVKAHMWWNLAAAHGEREGVHLREYVATQMTRDEIDEAQKQAREWASGR